MTKVDVMAESVFLRLPASPRYLRIARVVASALATELGADVDRLDDVRLAVGEVCSLCFAAGAESVELDFEVRDDSLTVRGECRPATIEFEPELGLTRQILRVTTAQYDMSCDSSAVSFRLQFRTAG